MNKDLQSYVSIYNNFFNDVLCDKVVDELKSVDWIEHKFYNSSTKEVMPLSGSQELDMSFDCISTQDEIMKLFGDGFKNYIEKLKFPWFDMQCVTGYTPVRYNRYVINRKMREHCDHIQTMFDGERKGIPTLSALAVFNDDYSGGDFIMWEDITITLKKGDLLIFPSNYLYPHKVEPVISGVRYTGVSWLW